MLGGEVLSLFGMVLLAQNQFFPALRRVINPRSLGYDSAEIFSVQPLSTKYK